jgi:hypothetical protein
VVTGDGAKRPGHGTGDAWLCRALLGGALVAALVLAPTACGSKRPEVVDTRAPASGGTGVALVPVACGEDQVREYRCEALLPLSSALPAPEPYGACPGAIDVVDPIYVPLSKSASFDAPHTEFMRRRAPPGHQCCYSWCARLEVARAADVPPGGRCNEPLAFPEKLCMPEPEGALSTERAAPPFNRCAVAVRPPQAAVFSVPNAALLHPGLTSQRRGLGFAECCYAWCSIAPPGSGLERHR